MKEKEELVKLGDRVRASILETLTHASMASHIPRQQLSDDALAFYLNQDDAEVRERRKSVLAALKRSFPMIADARFLVPA